MHVFVGLERAVLLEGQQVHRRQVTGRVIKEHILGTRVRSADRAIFRAGVPGVYRVVVLDAGIGAGPSGVTHLFPQIAGFDGLAHLAVFPVDQVPIRIVLDGLQEGIRDPDRVV